MGVDIHIKIAVYDGEKNLYKEVALFRERLEYEKYSYDEKGNKIEIENPLIKASVYEGRNSEMFDAMSDRNVSTYDGYGVFPSRSIMLESLDPSLKKEVEEKMNISGYYDFSEINLAEMSLYVAQHPTVVDYDSDEWEPDRVYRSSDPRPQKPNPIVSLYEDILSYIHFAIGYFTSLADFKVLYWFDH